MTTLIKTLINDEAGFILSAELVLVSTLSLLAISVGLSAASNALNSELQQLSGSFREFGKAQRQAASQFSTAPATPNDAKAVSILGRTGHDARQAGSDSFIAVARQNTQTR